MNLPLSESPIVPVPVRLPTPPSVRVPGVHAALREAQVWCVDFSYAGQEGNGGSYTLKFKDRHHCDTSWVRISQSTRNHLIRFCWEVIQERYPTWDGGPGSFGTLAWDTQADSIRHLHHQRVITVETTLFEGL